MLGIFRRQCFDELSNCQRKCFDKQDYLRLIADEKLPGRLRPAAQRLANRVGTGTVQAIGRALAPLVQA